jgi:hypothetical protein
MFILDSIEYFVCTFTPNCSIIGTLEQSRVGSFLYFKSTRKFDVILFTYLNFVKQVHSLGYI